MDNKRSHLKVIELFCSWWKVCGEEHISDDRMCDDLESEGDDVKRRKISKVIHCKHLMSPPSHHCQNCHLTNITCTCPRLHNVIKYEISFEVESTLCLQCSTHKVT